MRSPEDKPRPHVPVGPLPRPPRSLATGTVLAIGMSAAGVGVAEALPARSILEPAESRAAPVGARELLVVDARVPHRELLVAAVRRGVETIVVDADRDGLAQIELALRGRDVSAIHLVAHGRPGEVRIGSTILDARTATARRVTLARWFGPRAPFEQPPELLVYGCEAASGAEGASLLRALAETTGAEVAASVDRTGSPAFGADWVLEASTGPIDASLPIAWAAARAYPATLEVFQVTTNAASGAGSLAQAVADANANANPGETDIIQFGSVTGTITPGATLSVTEPLSVAGPGAGVLMIDGAGTARIFEVTSALALANVTLANGAATDGGGGALRVNGATLSVEDCVLTGNRASGNGGAIAAYDANVLVADTALEGNAAALGGALFVAGSSLDVVASSFEQNTASADGGALAVDSSICFVDDSLLAGNEAAGAGGAIHAAHEAAGPPLVGLQNSTVSGNTAASGGGVAVAGSAYAELTHVTVTANTITDAASSPCVASGVDGCGLSGTGIVIVESSVLAGNLEGTSPGVDLGGDALDLELEVRSSLVGLLEGGVATSGEPIFGEDALLGPLADNGGATRTHALLTGSPAIDEGENPSALAYDQRGPGFPRVLGAAADMGAYEWSEELDGNGGGGGDGGATDGGGPSGPKGPGGDDGCGCSVPGAGGDGGTTRGGVVAALVGLLAFLRRRRARD